VKALFTSLPQSVHPALRCGRAFGLDPSASHSGVRAGDGCICNRRLRDLLHEHPECRAVNLVRDSASLGVAVDQKLRIGDVIELGGRREVMMVLAQ